MGRGTRLAELEAELRSLRRRVEELEATAFQLESEEEVILVTVPRDGRFRLAVNQNR